MHVSAQRQGPWVGNAAKTCPCAGLCHGVARKFGRNRRHHELVGEEEEDLSQHAAPFHDYMYNDLDNGESLWLAIPFAPLAKFF